MGQDEKKIKTGFAVVNIISGLIFSLAGIISIANGTDVVIGLFMAILCFVISIIGVASFSIRKGIEDEANMKIIKLTNSICFGISVSLWSFFLIVVILAITGVI